MREWLPCELRLKWNLCTWLFVCYFSLPVYRTERTEDWISMSIMLACAWCAQEPISMFDLIGWRLYEGLWTSWNRYDGDKPTFLIRYPSVFGSVWVQHPVIPLVKLFNGSSSWISGLHCLTKDSEHFNWGSIGWKIWYLSVFLSVEIPLVFHGETVICERRLICLFLTSCARCISLARFRKPIFTGGGCSRHFCMAVRKILNILEPSHCYL